MEKACTSLFTYGKEDFHLRIQSNSQDSRFDKELKEKWCKAEQDNAIRYSVQNVQNKVLEGKHSFYLQLNTARSIMRRKPEEIVSMSQPFDEKRFNFTKLASKEILLDVGDGGGNDIIAVNDSPILWSHSLLITQRFQCLPQEVNLYNLQKVIEIFLLSTSENFRVVFNSLCANASVNHLHWHSYYLNHRMTLEWIPLKHFIDKVYVLEDFPSKGFCILFSKFEEKNLEMYASYAFKVISCMQKNKIPHNIYITRSKTDPKESDFDDIRIYIWARKPAQSSKKCDGYKIAACECFGHLPICSTESFERLDEGYVIESLKDVTHDFFLTAQEKLLAEFRNNVLQRNNFIPSV